MKWTVLSDNRSCRTDLETEHGLSVLLETDKHRILLDTGASSLFIRNAERLGIDLRTVNYVFISHGHNDHAGGLRYLTGVNQQAQIIVSPEAVNGSFFSKRNCLHSLTADWSQIPQDRICLIEHSCRLSISVRQHCCVFLNDMDKEVVMKNRARLVLLLSVLSSCYCRLWCF